MPQMYPLLWLYLMLTFIISFLMILALNYFSIYIKPLNTKFINKKSLINWKW